MVDVLLCGDYSVGAEIKSVFFVAWRHSVGYPVETVWDYFCEVRGIHLVLNLIYGVEMDLRFNNQFTSKSIKYTAT